MQYRKQDAKEEDSVAVHRRNKNSLFVSSVGREKVCVNHDLKEKILQLCRNSDDPVKTLKTFLSNVIFEERFPREELLVTSITTISCFVNDSENIDKKRESELLSSFSQCLKALVKSTEQELILLKALQESLITEKLKKGALLRWFMALYEEEVVQEETFLKWKEEVDARYEGKGEALIQLNKWLTWLEQAEEEDSDEEDDDI